MQTLVEMGDFDGLDAFARSKKSPIGYEPFVHHLLEKGQRREAASYVSRCDASRRVDLYIECGDWKLAGKECKEQRNKGRLEYVLLVVLVDGIMYQFNFRQLKRTCPDAMIARELDQLLSTMS